MRSTYTRKRALIQGGFTLLELMASVAILTVVVGVVITDLTTLQQRNKAETSKVDLSQEVRQFQDQIVSDIHLSGYPGLQLFDPLSPSLVSATNCTLDINVACGLLNVTPTALQFEADVDGSGTVSEVFIQLSPANGPCPCVIQRGTETKLTWRQTATPPIYYTEVNNVVNTTIFQGYDNAGNSVALTGVPSNNLNAIEITLNVRPALPDVNGSYPTITMSTAAKIHNFN